MARNRNRQPGPILRNVVAPRPAPTVGTDPARRIPTGTIVVTGPGPRMGRAKGGGMPSGDGRGISLWHAPAEVSGSTGMIARDRRWTATVSDHG